MSKYLASVVICTFRRLNLLELALQGLASQTLRGASFEVVVVDNACDLDTKLLTKRYTNYITNLSYVTEPNIGLSYARNRALSEIQSELVVFLDDDAVPRNDWLENLLRFACDDSTRLVIGGAVLPKWQHEPPKWLTNDLYPALSLCSYGESDKGFVLDFPRQYPVGANIAYNKEILMEMGGFPLQFGRRGNVLLSGEETILNYKYQAADYPIWFCPHAIVDHFIPSERLNRKYFRSRYYWDGKTLALVHYCLYGSRFIQRELIRRLTRGIFVKLPGYIYHGVLVRRNPLLAELLWRHFFGYLIQSFDVLK